MRIDGKIDQIQVNVCASYPVFGYFVAGAFFSPANQTHRMESAGFSSAGRWVSIDATSICEEIAEHSHCGCWEKAKFRSELSQLRWCDLPCTGPDSIISVMMSLSLLSEYAGPTRYKWSRGTWVGVLQPADDSVSDRRTLQWVDSPTYG